jgi:PadR family transcriptional regulator, regulatory protein AphA
VSTVRLGPTSYVVLGIIAVRGPSTPYELKRFVEVTLGHFWSFPHSQLYAEPARLAEAGLLTEEREEGGRRRRTYAITPAGREAVQAWVGEPSPGTPELRDLGLLKLFFSELADDEVFHALVQEQIAVHRAILTRYEWLRRRFADRPEYARRAVTLHAGFGMEHALLAFWERLAEEPEMAGARPAAQASRPSESRR